MRDPHRHPRRAPRTRQRPQEQAPARPPTTRSWPLHNNARESDIRPYVTRRKVSSGTRSENGRLSRDAFQSLIKTAARHGYSAADYLNNRLGIPGAPDVPWLPVLAPQLE